METKNIIIQNYARAIVDASANILNASSNFTNNEDENNAIVKTLNVLVESLRSQTIIIQGALDEYN